MDGNLTIWDRYADIDPKFTKPITGRDYSGTSPNPQYVIKCLTDLFGPVGKGFGWQVVAEDFTLLGDTHLHWCRIRFWWKDDDGRHECEQYGQTKAAYKTSKGFFRVDEDAPKKSLTDAIVKAASHLGIAANIFLGRWDDQKYVQEVNQDYRQQEQAGRSSARQEEDRTTDQRSEQGRREVDNQQRQRLSKSEARPVYESLQKQMRGIGTSADLASWWSDPDCKDLRSKLPEDWRKALYNEFAETGREMKGKETTGKNRITDAPGRELHPTEAA